MLIMTKQDLGGPYLNRHGAGFLNEHGFSHLNSTIRRFLVGKIIPQGFLVPPLELIQMQRVEGKWQVQKSNTRYDPAATRPRKRVRTHL